ncbi:MAG TPA: hypothetical protein VNK91_06500 [Burkholderiaceae bacterium]|nr:hypothetical protein [Burkholderiaceae bacterium]
MSTQGQTAPQEAGAAAPAAKPNGSGAEPFKGPYYEDPRLAELFDDDLKRFAAGKAFPDLKTQLRQGMEADRMARERNVIEAPDPKALDKWFEKYGERIGWVPDATKYQLKDPDKVPEGVRPDNAIRDLVAKTAHKHKIPLPAAQGLYADLFNYFSGKIAEQAARMAKAEQDLAAELEREWGADKERNIELARRAVRHFAVDDDTKEALERALGAPKLIKFFHRLGSMIGEDKLEASAGGGGALPESLAALEVELARLESDPEWMKVFRDPRHRLYKEHVAQRQRIIDRMAALMQPRR